MRASPFALALTVALAGACSERPSAPTPAPTPVSRVAEAGTVDLAQAMRNAHFAYRPIADGPNEAWVASDAAYRVVARPGALSITPSARLPLARSPMVGAEAQVHTSITRGDARLGDARASAKVDDTGALSFDHGDVVETLRDDERGIELSWAFATAPRGQGDVVVRLSVTGHAPTGRTASGAHFADERTGLGLVIGHGTFIDALGGRTDVPVELEGGDAVLRLPTALIASARFPAVLDPVISPELGMDAPVVIDALGDQVAPSIACGSTVCLAVWTDRRRGQADLFGARIDKTGAVLDALGLPIATADAEDSTGKVAWNGTSFVVTWSLDETTSTSSGAVARVDASGAVLDATPKPVAFTRSTETAIACAAGPCMIAGVDMTGAVRLVRLDASGAVLDTTPKTLATGADKTSRPAIAHLGGTWLVAWTDATTMKIQTLRVDGTGAALDAAPGTPITASGSQTDLALASNATGFFLAWEDLRAIESELYGSRLDATGKALDPTGIAIRKGTNLELDPSVVFDGTNWVIGWTDTVPRTVLSNARCARVNATGKLVDATPIAVTTDDGSTWLALAADGAGVTGVWSTRGVASSDVWTARISAAGAVSARTVVTKAANHQERVSASWSGTQYLVVWADSRSNDDTSDVYGVRVSATGTVLDPSGIAISKLAGVLERNPVVAHDGTNWLVAWDDTRNASGRYADIYGARVDATGKVLDPSGLLLRGGMYAETDPAMVFDGTHYMLVWRHFSGSGAVEGHHVTTAGVPVEAAPTPLITGVRYDPAIAFDGTSYLVLAAQAVFNAPTGADIDAVRVGKSGAPLAPVFQVVTAPWLQSEPRVAFDGKQYLVVWQDLRNGVHEDIFGARVATDGTILDPGGFAIVSAPGKQLTPDVVFDGTDFFVAWADGRGASYDVLGAFVSPTGVVRAPSSLAIASSADDERAPRVAVASKTRRLVAYTRFDLAPTYRSLRARARFVDGLPSGAPCTGASECVSGACVDGVCCESACSGQCEACDVPGQVGFCVAVSGAPRGARAACGGAGVGTTCASRCDGVDRAKCTYAAADTVACSAAECKDGIEKHAAFCDGAGACKDVPKPCGAYVCGLTACKTECAASSDCIGGHYCKDKTCVPVPGLGEPCPDAGGCATGSFCVDGICCGSAACGAGESCALPGNLGRCRKVDGATCSIGLECGSGQCVDGVCCESACAGQCEACDLEGSKGRCRPVSGAPRGARPACDKGGELCAETTCDGAKDTSKCVGFAKTSATPCKSARCEGAKFFAEATCTGTGSCGAQPETSCVPFACDATGCRKACSAKEHCAEGFVCRDGTCEAPGTKCTADGTAVEGAGGVTASCAPYVCKGGACVASCESGADCTGGTVCDANSRCVPRPPPTVVDDGGGCSVGARAGGSAFALSIVVAGLLTAARRRERLARRGRAAGR